MISRSQKSRAKAWLGPRQLLTAALLVTTFCMFRRGQYSAPFSSWNVTIGALHRNSAVDGHYFRRHSERVKSKNVTATADILWSAPSSTQPQRMTKVVSEFLSVRGTRTPSSITETGTTAAITISPNSTVTYLTEHAAKGAEAGNATSMSATPLSDTNSPYGNLSAASKAVLLKLFADAYPQEEPKKVRGILEVAYFRSGSSFLGQLLSANPRTFYHFEPLRTLSAGSRLSGKAALRGLDYIADFFSCIFANHADHLRLAMKFPHPFRQNSYLWNACAGVKRICLDPEFLNAVCKTAPTQVMKVVRIDMDTVRRFLLDGRTPIAGEFSVVHLVRDPRAIWLSRQKRGWCRGRADCSSARVLCDEIERDLDVFENLRREFPGPTIQVRYEDLAMDPLNVTVNLYDKLGMPFTAFVKKFIESHTSERNVKVRRNPYATSRNSKDMVDAWKRRIKPSHARRINWACRRVIKRLGYEL
ncbi:carbohydrate sulfotransferase 5-like isoform X1 [Dermacentor albipictus]|uniref:carbohydrate sulfotransferase 5-like isoform X1 n=1 Tax=Dermacentor albipictus TaxID=60249 RepID=UPI0038FBFD66